MAKAKHKHHSVSRHHSNHNHANHNHRYEDELGNNEADIENATQRAAEAGRRNVKQAQRSVLAAFQTFDVFGGPMVRLMEHNRVMLQKMLHTMQEQSLEFFNRSLEHTGQAIESCRDCRDLSELMSVQQDWMLNFVHDYAERTKRFTDMMRELADDGAETLSEVSSEAKEHRHVEEDHVEA